MNIKINWLAILVSTLAGMTIGFLFYGFLFLEAWQVAVGLATPDNVNFTKYGNPIILDPVTPMIINTLLMVAYGVFMTWLTGQTGRTSAAGGASLGALIGLLIAASSAVGNMFAVEPTMLSVIDGAYHLVLFTVIGAIVGGWRKRRA
ncbi:DUF1761 domain-containing protein [Neolewinella lacunae]|uniref:DUF1761 domain-containing protein n=1 Tax=Neolewinella lacunae TaxID=1517758 RepID=A0A923PHL8_9BACT|nr:DUF1761 domain-containing protein [Neolewinella lacunae]MBC6994283.1 DUF1761 domain-containing protein [Neolewinella lacunae]MDN3635339.1 DUF1761 domain-containing protein [Neolewinella lacunae]